VSIGVRRLSTAELVAQVIRPTFSGKHAVGKLLKLRADMLFLLLANAPRSLVVLTERDMYDLCLKERLRREGAAKH
jgi:hypothetical protein